MPTLTRRPEIDTALPGLTRRRVWRAPQVRSHAVVCLTPAKLYLAPASDADPEAVATAVENGADPDAAFGPTAAVIEVTSVRKVTHDLLTNTLTVEHLRPAEAGGGVAAAAVEFATHEAADEAFTSVWRRLGERFALTPHTQDGWELARAPVAFMSGVLVATLTLSLVANAAADAGGASGPLALFAAADWRWVCGLGGAALAGLQVWLYRRLTRPPEALELLPR